MDPLPGSLPLRSCPGQGPGTARATHFAPLGQRKKTSMQIITNHRPAPRLPLPNNRPAPAGTLTEAEIRQIIQEMMG